MAEGSVSVGVSEVDGCVIGRLARLVVIENPPLLYVLCSQFTLTRDDYLTVAVRAHAPTTLERLEPRPVAETYIVMPQRRVAAREAGERER